MFAKSVRISLIVLEVFVALTAVVGGIGLSVTNGLGMPLQWLQGSPFSSYVIPGLALAILVGGSSLLAAWLMIAGHGWGALASLAAGFCMMVFEVVEVAVIGLLTWMQPFYFGIGLLIMALAVLLGRAGQRGPAPLPQGNRATEEERELAGSRSK